MIGAAATSNCSFDGTSIDNVTKHVKPAIN